jgi:hypothetical protein
MVSYGKMHASIVHFRGYVRSRLHREGDFYSRDGDRNSITRTLQSRNHDGVLMKRQRWPIWDRRTLQMITRAVNGAALSQVVQLTSVVL